MHSKDPIKVGATVTDNQPWIVAVLYSADLTSDFWEDFGPLKKFVERYKSNLDPKFEMDKWSYQGEPPRIVAFKFDARIEAESLFEEIKNAFEEWPAGKGDLFRIELLQRYTGYFGSNRPGK